MNRTPDTVPAAPAVDASVADGYRAGACNIGPAEIAGRRRAGRIFLAVAAVVAVALIVLGVPPIARVLLFPFLAAGLVTYEQARRRFCVGFAVAGLRNFGPLGSPQAVTDDADRAADRRAALRMTLEMSAVAAVITAVFVLLPIG